MARTIRKPPGRTKPPTELRILQGNPTGKPIPIADEPKPVEPIGEAPTWMTAVQRECWEVAIRQMPPDFFRRCDASILIQFVVADCNFRAAIQRQNAVKLDIISDEAIKIRKAIREEGEVMARAAAQLGFSPSSRASLGTAVMKAKNAFEKFKTGPHPGQSKPAVTTSK